MANTLGDGAGGGGGGDGSSDSDGTSGGRDADSGRTGLGDAIHVTFAVAGAFAEYLKATFLTSKNKLRWQDLGGSLIGGLFIAVWQGLIGIPIALGSVVAEFVWPITNAMQDGGAHLSASIRETAAAVWDPAQLGIASLPVNAAVVVLAGAAIAYGVKYSG
ncbi:MAG: hypothetical protein ABEI57_00655 [Halapricum sp.]